MGLEDNKMNNDNDFNQNFNAVPNHNTNNNPNNNYNNPYQNNNYNNAPPQITVNNSSGFPNSNHNVVVTNQVNAIVISIDEFKSSSISTVCPQCKVQINTNPKTNFSMTNYCLYYCLGPIVWIIYQAVKNKDYNCTDAQHYCPNCKYLIATYTAC